MYKALNNKKSIVYIHTGVWPSKSPSCTFVTYNALALSNVFDNVYLFVKKGSSYISKEVLQQRFSTDQPSNLHIYSIRYSLLKTNRLYYIFVILRLLLIVNKIDIVITRNVTFLPNLLWIKKYLKKAVFFESHDFYTDLSIREDKQGRINKRNSQIEQKYLPSLTGLICLQNTQKELYRKYLPDLPIYVLRTGINQIEFSHSDCREYICYIGSFETHKGIEALISASALSATKPTILIIGGKSDNEIKDLKKIASLYNYQDKIEITGWINKSEMKSYLTKVRVGIVSLEPTFFNKYITSPLKIFDYYSFGIPVIATDLPTIRELVEEGVTGLLFESGNIQSFADKIDKLYTDDVLYSEMIKQVLKKAKTLLWTQRALEFSKIAEVVS